MLELMDINLSTAVCGTKAIYNKAKHIWYAFLLLRRTHRQVQRREVSDKNMFLLQTFSNGITKNAPPAPLVSSTTARNFGFTAQ